MENKHTGFRLSSDKTGKDLGKAAYANAYIGFGVAHRRSSTGIYLDDAVAQGIPAGEGIIPDASTVAFVSVASEGSHNERTVFLARKVIRMGVTVIMDAPVRVSARRTPPTTDMGKEKCRRGWEHLPDIPVRDTVCSETWTIFTGYQRGSNTATSRMRILKVIGPA